MKESEERSLAAEEMRQFMQSCAFRRLRARIEEHHANNVALVFSNPGGVETMDVGVIVADSAGMHEVLKMMRDIVTEGETG